jgi:hypothetical protein
MFLLYHSEGYNIYKTVLCKCYVNDLYTTTCSGVLIHRKFGPPFGTWVCKAISFQVGV